MKLSKENTRRMLTALRKLEKNGPTDPGYGICLNLDKVFIQGRTYVCTYAFVARASINWPGRTGELRPHGACGTPVCSFPILLEYAPVLAGSHLERRERVPLWEGSQLEQRQSLIKYLIESLTA